VTEDSNTVSRRIDFRNQKEAMRAFGEYDSNIKDIEKRYAVAINSRGTSVLVSGRQHQVEAAVNELRNMSESSGEAVMDDREGILLKTPTGKPIRPLSAKQSEYVSAMKNRDLVVAIGPAGTGKTFLACVQAVRFLLKGEVERIILTRPVVEAGEKLGFLPGDLQEKVKPYLKPLYDAFYAVLGPAKFQRFRKDEVIEIVPLAYMRGRTLDDAVIILDEAQNTSSGQMQMFLTRMGFNSRAVITGDITQVDLADNMVSGLIELQHVLKDVEGVEFIYFTKQDVVRHQLVKRIIDAYYRFKKVQKQ